MLAAGGSGRDLTKGRRRDQGAVKISCARQDPNARNCHGYRKFVRRSTLENPANGCGTLPLASLCTCHAWLADTNIVHKLRCPSVVALRQSGSFSAAMQVPEGRHHRDPLHHRTGRVVWRRAGQGWQCSPQSACCAGAPLRSCHSYNSMQQCIIRHVVFVWLFGKADGGKSGQHWSEKIYSNWTLCWATVILMGWDARQFMVVVCGWQVPPQTMGRDMQLLLDSTVGSDVTFLVEDERMQAHRIILQAASFPYPILSGRNGLDWAISAFCV